jgi:parvulin-like peptidyl-prolyl isomerase
MRLTLTVLLAAALAGCSTEEPTPLDSAAFYRKDRAIAQNAPRPAVGPVDESGGVDPIVRRTQDDPGVSGISEVVSDAIRGPRIPEPTTLPSTQPASTQPLNVAVATLSESPTTLPTGQYMVVGVVVAEVDGQPIFANKILALSQRELAVRAKELDEKSFRRLAMQQIERDQKELVRNELEFRAAQRSLSEDERKLARSLTTKWLNETVAHAGGSEVQLRQRLRAEGFDFDEVLEERHREFMAQVYYQRKVIPMIVITADAMREYYDKYKEKEFSEQAGVSFRVIKVSTKEVGDSERARSLADEIHAEAVAEPDKFAQLATRRNKEETLAKSGGMPIEGLLSRGSWKVKEVEDAAWELQPGEVSPVVTVGDDYYIVKLERKSAGKTEPFHNEKVQDKIRRTLYAEQFRQMREREQKKLEREAIIRVDPRSMQLMLDMAMQRYRQWRGS